MSTLSPTVIPSREWPTVRTFSGIDHRLVAAFPIHNSSHSVDVWHHDVPVQRGVTSFVIVETSGYVDARADVSLTYYATTIAQALKIALRLASWTA